jgi:tetratricopeptide (TPR) repeat protein
MTTMANVADEAPLHSGKVPLEEDIRENLAQILASDTFRSAPQLGAFLRFVVEKTIQGQTEQIKGYTIATQALGRTEDFDPQIDPIVRVEAMRLRKNLDAYYAKSGANDTLRIHIPRGGYVPVFTKEKDKPLDVPFLNTPVIAATNSYSKLQWKAHFYSLLLPFTVMVGLTAIVITAASSFVTGSPFSQKGSGLQRSPSSFLPFSYSAPGEVRIPVVQVKSIRIKGETLPRQFSEWLHARILQDLSRFDELITVSRDEFPVTKDTYTLTVQGTPDGTSVSFEASLLHNATGQIIWSKDLSAKLLQKNIDKLENIISQEIVTTLAQPHGIIFSDLRTRRPEDPRLGCLIDAHDYFYAPNAETHRQVRDCLEDAVEEAENFHSGRAALTYIYLEELRAGFNPLPETLERSIRTARRAVDLAPESARAHQALMAALFASGDQTEALRIGEHSLELNPLDSTITATLGSRYLWAGRYQEALQKLQKAAAVNPGRPAWYDLYIFFAAYMLGDIDLARSAAIKLVAVTPLSLIGQIIAADMNNDTPRARYLHEKLAKIAPDYVKDPRSSLLRNGFPSDMVERFSRTLIQVGL